MDPTVLSRLGQHRLLCFFYRGGDDIVCEDPPAFSRPSHTSMIAAQGNMANSALLCLSALFFATSAASAWVVNTPTSLHQQGRSGRCNHVSPLSVTTTSAASSPAPAADTSKDSRPSSTAIVGGGPTGLACALMLARRGYRGITVLERLGEPPAPDSEQWGNPERSYNLGIGGRGQVALAKLGAADRVLSWCAEAVVSGCVFLYFRYGINLKI